MTTRSGSVRADESSNSKVDQVNREYTEAARALEGKVEAGDEPVTQTPDGPIEVRPSEVLEKLTISVVTLDAINPRSDDNAFVASNHIYISDSAPLNGMQVTLVHEGIHRAADRRIQDIRWITSRAHNSPYDSAAKRLLR